MSTATLSRRRRAVIPGPRKAAVSAPAPAPAPAPATTSPAISNSLAYLDFLYGFGVGPDIDLGTPKAYTHVPTAAGCVFREDFERGIALCNCADVAAEVALERAYYDQDRTPQTSVSVPPRTVKVFFNEPC